MLRMLIVRVGIHNLQMCRFFPLYIHGYRIA